ncbi:MAG: hypothetical protein ACOC7J_05110, partial [Armatimonadota bacterium]
GQQCTVRRTGEALARFVEPPRPLFEHRRHPHCEEYGHYLSAAVPRVSEQTIAWVLAAGPRGGVDVEARAIEGPAGGVQVRVGDAVDTIALGGDGTVEAGAISLAGAAAMVRDSRAGVHRYALVEGTALALGSADLIASDVPVGAGAVVGEKLLRASITCSEPASVTLHCPVQPDMVRLTGIDAPVDVSFHEEAGMVTLGLPEGSYRLEVREL